MRLIALLVFITVLGTPFRASAWNIPGHMLSAAIAYQVLSHESPQSIEKAKAVLEKHPWYANQWQTRFENAPIADHSLILFMQAARWPDDVRRDKEHHRGPWHYINWPFKPDGEPDRIRTKEPEKENILTALAGNQRIAKSGSALAERAIALAWLFHLVGDIHLPLHTTQLFTVKYPTGDKGGTEILRAGESRGPTNASAQVLGWRDHLKLKPCAVTK